MYIALFDINCNNICLITKASCNITKNAYDFDVYDMSGHYGEEINNAILFTFNEDSGKQIHSGLIKKIEPINNTVRVIGRDFRELFNTEILIDFVTNAPPSALSDLFAFTTNVFKNDTDTYIDTIPFDIVIPQDLTNVWNDFGEISPSVFTKDLYNYLLPFLKYYNYIITATFDWSIKKIVFTFTNARVNHKIKLKDFSNEQTQTEPDVNKVIPGEDAPGGTMEYYYLDKQNNIVHSNNIGDIPNRYYPVKTKYFLEENLSDAKYKAILELCNNRFVDVIYLDVNSPLNPIDLSTINLNDTVDIYSLSAFYKQLPVSQINLKVDSTGVKRKIKLGFKKDKLTEILQG